MLFSLIESLLGALMNRSERLREWTAAERFAVVAEEMVRTARNRKANGQGDGPSEEIVRIAAERRAAADALLRALLDEAKSQPKRPPHEA